MKTVNGIPPIGLGRRRTEGSLVEPQEDGWRLQIPAGRAGRYRLAQLDDYAALARRDFPWSPPLSLRLDARVARPDLPGTWGFGLWNDPFGLALSFGAGPVRLPCLPNCAWFFYASPPNHLCLDDAVPGSGFFAGTFRSPSLPGAVLLPALAGLPLLLIRPLSRWVRRSASRIIRQEGSPVAGVVSSWHNYAIHWLADRCVFECDEKAVHQSATSPGGPLSLVIWIDNQYAAWRPGGFPRHGLLGNNESWLEVRRIQVEIPAEGKQPG